MKRRLLQLGILFVLIFLVFLSFSSLMPIIKPEPGVAKTKFSTYRALQQVEALSQHPHAVGTEVHNKVRNYIVSAFQNLGLEVHTQSDYTVSDFGVLTRPVNIVTQIKGSHPQLGSDLLVLAHYDSAPHSSYGASDDASGVAAILESVRALKAKGFSPKNNIVICITDAEEIGLIGAKLFAQKHPWVQNVGLVLNFEARGTSGPSMMILETNHGNAQLIKHFAEADVDYPEASSLMYEVYKRMPNDTDATVFRVEKDIPSLFFAFIDNHFFYHTAKDVTANLDPNSLAHQGSYLMGLLPYLGQADLADLQTESEQIYFNFPILKLVHYNYSWIYPLAILAWLIGLSLIIWGFRTQQITTGQIFKAVTISFFGVLLAVALGYFGWQAVLHFNPQYLEIEQGFPYNGHMYIGAFVMLAIALQWIVLYFGKRWCGKIGILLGPLCVWLLLITALAIAFKGASYFVIPVLFLELSIALRLWGWRYLQWVHLILAIPMIFLLGTLVLSLPVALGMKITFASLAFLTLIFGMLWPTFINFKGKLVWSLIFVLAGIVFFISAQRNSTFTAEHPKPNSLVYMLDKTQQKAQWTTYDHILDEWTKQAISGQESDSIMTIGASKYGSQFTYADSAPTKAIPGVKIWVKTDTLIQTEQIRYKLNIVAERKLNELLIYSDSKSEMKILKANQILLKNLHNRSTKIRKTTARDTRLLTYIPVDKDTLRLSFKVPINVQPQIDFYGMSNDLLSNPWLKIQPRTPQMMPRPFVINDAIITKQSLQL